MEVEDGDIGDALLQVDFEVVGCDIDGFKVLSDIVSMLPWGFLAVCLVGLHIISMFRVPRPEYL